MTTILDKIIEEKKKVLEIFKTADQPILENRHVKRSFISVLKKASQVSIIAEYKRASPSKGDINTEIDPRVQAKTYVDAGADAVSVLTDTPFFKGSFLDLEAVRATVNSPILCKDFIIDKIQIDAAKRAGADLILLIAAALDDSTLHDFYQYARDLDLEVLMEVHDEKEAERALDTGNPLIGVNNRNLKTFEVDLGVTERIAPLIKQEGRYLISESGIKSVEDVERVKNVGANGILVGEALMRHGSVADAIKAMKLPLKEG